MRDQMIDDQKPSTSGVLVAAWAILDATRNAPESAAETLDTPMGTAEVTVGKRGAEVELREEGATIQVQLDG